MNHLVLPPEAKKQYRGDHVAKVVNVNDPEKFMRVQVRVYPLFENTLDKDLPWAEYKLPIGARPGQGNFSPVRVGDWVWVDFPHQGGTRRPRITGSVHHCPGRIPNLPHDAWEGPAQYEHQRTGEEPAPAPLGYHDGSIVMDENGVLIEVAADESVRVTQKASGSAIEITPDGKVTVHGVDQINVSAGKDINVLCAGITQVISDNKIELDGAGGSPVKGIVQGHCICAYT